MNHEERGRCLRLPALSRRARTCLLAIVVAGALVRLAHFVSLATGNYPEVMLGLDQMDMAGTWAWSGRILAGDVLGRDTWHPAYAWMVSIAPIETWYRWWGGPEIFQQAPFYAYFVALLRLVARDSHLGVLGLQLGLGALQPLVVFCVGRRLFGARAGLAAALLVALYGPLVFFQGTVLRDWLSPLLESLALLCLLRGDQQGGHRNWFAAGLLLGIDVLTKPTAAPFAAFAVLWAARGHARAQAEGAPSRSASRTAAAAVVLGGLLCLAPLVARNVAVGAPPFAMSNRFASAWIESNAADARPVGVFFPPSKASIFRASDGRPLEVIRATWATHADPWSGNARNALTKLRGLLDPWGAPNNVSYDYGKQVSPVLRVLLNFSGVVPLALAALLLNLGSWRRHLLVLALLLNHVLALVLFIVLARYRLVLLMPLALYAGLGLTQFAAALRTRPKRAAAGALLAAGLLVAQGTLIPLRELRSNAIYLPEYSQAATLYAEAGEPARALAELERMEAHVLSVRSDHPSLHGIRVRQASKHLDLANRALKDKRPDAVRRHTERAEVLLGANPPADASLALGALRLALGNRDRARAHFRAYLAQRPNTPLRPKLEAILAERR